MFNFIFYYFLILYIFFTINIRIKRPKLKWHSFHPITWVKLKRWKLVHELVKVAVVPTVSKLAEDAVVNIWPMTLAIIGLICSGSLM